jgi:hypothetical protein
MACFTVKAAIFFALAENAYEPAKRIDYRQPINPIFQKNFGGIRNLRCRRNRNDLPCHDIFCFKHGNISPLSAIFRSKANLCASGDSTGGPCSVNLFIALQPESSSCKKGDIRYIFAFWHDHINAAPLISRSGVFHFIPRLFSIRFMNLDKIL